jgi:hypothetical protein
MDESQGGGGGKNSHFVIDMFFAVAQRFADFHEPFLDLGDGPLESSGELG